MAKFLDKTNVKSKSALVGYIGATIMLIGFVSELPRRDSQSDIFKAINLAGATAAICLAGICRNTKKD